MKYVARTLEGTFAEASESFKAVMVVGARQVGKSTMLRHLARGTGRAYVTMDDADDRALARADPKLFLQAHKPPILIDEIQKAPELLEPIKIACDENDGRGLFWLTGSQGRRLRELAGDTLAGRLAILELFSMSQRELAGLPGIGTPDFSYGALVERQALFPPNDVVETYRRIWRGGMPDAQQLSDRMLATFFKSYVETHLMRDAVDDNGVRDVEGFGRLLRAAAACTGELLNYSTLARAADVSVPTAKEWVKVLQGMGVVYLLEPFANNSLKRLVKTPKLYFCDTGLAAHLSRWPSAEVLMDGAASGHFYESFVVMELVRSYSYDGGVAGLSFYRDADAREIDLVVEEGKRLHPLEVKKTASPKRPAAGLGALSKAEGFELSSGGVICMADAPRPLDSLNCAIPSNLI